MNRPRIYTAKLTVKVTPEMKAHVDRGGKPAEFVRGLIHKDMAIKWLLRDAIKNGHGIIVAGEEPDPNLIEAINGAEFQRGEISGHEIRIPYRDAPDEIESKISPYARGSNLPMTSTTDGEPIPRDGLVNVEVHKGTLRVKNPKKFFGIFGRRK